MRINFTNIQVNQEKEISKAQTAEKKEIRAAAVFAENPFSATQTKQGIYDKQGKTMEDIQAETADEPAARATAEAAAAVSVHPKRKGKS